MYNAGQHLVHTFVCLTQCPEKIVLIADLNRQVDTLLQIINMMSSWPCNSSCMTHVEALDSVDIINF